MLFFWRRKKSNNSKQKMSSFRVDYLIASYLYYCCFGEIPFDFVDKKEILAFDPVKYRVELSYFWYRYWNNQLDPKIKEVIDACF